MHVCLLIMHIVGKHGASTPALEGSAVRRYTMEPCAAVTRHLTALPTAAPLRCRDILKCAKICRAPICASSRASNAYAVMVRWFDAVPILVDRFGWLLSCCLAVRILPGASSLSGLGQR